MTHRLPGRRLVLALGLSLNWLAGLPRAFALPPAPSPSCGQKGKARFDKDTFLLDASGHKLARFSGGESAVTLLSPPADGTDLARIETGTGRGSFRLQGFVKASELPIYAASAVPVVSSHVWLAAGTRVVAAGSSGGRVRIEKQLATPFNQRFSGSAECGALTFNPPAPAGFSVPGAARVFLMKEATLELFDEVPPTGTPIFTLQRSSLVESVRFFSNEQRGGFVHITYHGEVTIDAWAKASDLSPLPRGETSDVPPGSYSMSSPPELQLSPLPRVVKATREAPLRLAAKDADTPVGVIEAETEVFVMDVMAGWAKVLPKSLHILPAGDASFWVKSADLGL